MAERNQDQPSPLPAIDHESGVRMSKEQLASPEMQAAIAKARERMTRPSGGGGSTAEDLERLIREIRRELATPT